MLLHVPEVSAQSPWASLNEQGTLVYGQLKTGDHIADFSSAGYRGGGVALPVVPTVRTVASSGKDDTAAIQQALDEVGRMPLKDGSRGAVQLSAGTFLCAGTLNLHDSGVVLRGTMGASGAGTEIQMTGRPHLAIKVAGTLVQRYLGQPTVVTDAYVPSGTTTFHVEDAAGLSSGDTVLISKPVTTAWVHFMGMDALGERKGRQEHWISGTLDVRRKIASVSGNLVTLEVPLMDSYDAAYLGARTVSVRRVGTSGQIAEAGVESLRVVAPQRHIKLGEPEFDGLKMTDAVDSWVRSVEFLETTSSIGIDRGTERITVVSVKVVNHAAILSSAKPFDMESMGTQILFDRCSGSGDDTFYFATQEKQQGPVVLLDCHFDGNGSIQPHQRWSTGLLVDNCEVPKGGIDLIDRGMMGSGHGWTTAWSVIWNSMASTVEVNSPPGAANWSIGNRGTELDPKQPEFEGHKEPLPLHGGQIESAGKPIAPRSLYLQQLKERLGPGALEAIGH